MNGQTTDAQDSVTIILNGDHRQFAAPLTIAELAGSLELGGKRVAVECNGAIIPRSRHAATLLATGDRIEIVTAVGGG